MSDDDEIIFELDDEDGVAITDWVAPWLDNGERLLELVQSMREMNDSDCWQVIICVLMHHLSIDLEIVRQTNRTAAMLLGYDEDGNEPDMS